MCIRDRSVVYRGWDARLGRDVAVKVLRADLAGDPSFQARFRRETQNAASLNHPAIVAVYDSGETGPVPYVVIEYVDGDTLRNVLKREGPPPPRRAMQIVADVCAALDFSHRHGIVHRDVTPANIMLNRAGAVKVMYFGIARAVSDGQAIMTAASAVYLSPEQARGESVDARSDVYATGCMLYELLTGTPPFTGDSPAAIAHRHVREAPRPPSAAQPGVGSEIDAIVLKALNKNPLNRYQTAAEMRSDLVRALSVQAVQAVKAVKAVQASPLRPDGERTEAISEPPPRFGVAGSPALLAPLVQAVSAQDREPEVRIRPHRGQVAAGIGAVCLALAAAIWLTLRVVTAPPPPALVAVPDLSGMSLTQATAALQADRLTLGTVTPIASSQANKEKIVDQRPSGQTVVTQDTAINLDIGTGAAS